MTWGAETENAALTLKPGRCLAFTAQIQSIRAVAREKFGSVLSQDQITAEPTHLLLYLGT